MYEWTLKSPLRKLTRNLPEWIETLGLPHLNWGSEKAMRASNEIPLKSPAGGADEYIGITKIEGRDYEERATERGFGCIRNDGSGGGNGSFGGLGVRI